MTDTLNELVGAQALGLAHRVRRAAAGQLGAACLVLLHGVGANETGFVELARRMDPQLTVILLRAPLDFGPMRFGWFPVTFTANGPLPDVAQAERSRQLLVDFIGRLPAAYDVDPARLWIAGFSQGGIMSASVALTAPRLVAGFGILSGRIMPEVLPQVVAGEDVTKLQAFLSHGTQDDKLGIHFAHHARQVLESLHVPLAYHEYPAGHTLNEAMVLDFSGWLADQLVATSR